MRVLFTVSDWTGHYFCMVPLAWAFQAAGHEVRIACPEPQAATISRAGLLPVPVLDGLDMTYVVRMMYYVDAVDGKRTLPGLPVHPVTGEPVKSLDDFDIEAAKPALWEELSTAIRRSCDGIVEFATAWRPSLVIHDLISLEGALAARVLDIPAVMFGPGLMGCAETAPGLDVCPSDITGSFPRHGVAPWERDQVEYMIDPSPALAAPPVGRALRIPLRYVPYNGPGTVPSWTLHRGSRPRLTLVWTNTATKLFGPAVPTLRHAVEAAARTGAEVVVTTTPAQAEALTDLPDGVRVLSNFPLQVLLETSDAVIHHGSSGCVMTGAVAGIPQLILPLAEDQLCIGERCLQTGAVISIPGLQAEAGEIRAGVEAIVGESRYRRAAERLRDDVMGHPTPAQTVETLEKLATTGRLTARDLPARPPGTAGAAGAEAGAVSGSAGR